MQALLSDADLARIEAAVRAAERGTSAEIVVALARGESGFAQRLLWPALAALTLPLLLLLAYPRLEAATVYALQLALLTLGFALTLLPAVQDRLSPPPARRARARQRAQAQFFASRLHLTAARTGILLFIAPAERYAEIITDAGAGGPLADTTWQPSLDELLREAGQGRLTEGILSALERLGATLREQLPAGPEDRNEVPDRPVVL